MNKFVEKVSSMRDDEQMVGDFNKSILINLGKRQSPQKEVTKGPNAYDYNDNSADQLIGRGGFGYVFRALRKFDNKMFAIKVAKEK